jgi:hypothetical protein
MTRHEIDDCLGIIDGDRLGYASGSHILRKYEVSIPKADETTSNEYSNLLTNVALLQVFSTPDFLVI